MTELLPPRAGSRDRGAVRLEQGLLTLLLGHDAPTSARVSLAWATPVNVLSCASATLRSSDD